MDSTPKTTWHKIAKTVSEINFQANGLTELEINGNFFCIGKHNNQLFACAQKCPHAGSVLSTGYIDAVGNLVCPLHRYKFNPKNGRNVSGEGYFLKTFLIEEREDGVFIYLEESTFYAL